MTSRDGLHSRTRPVFSGRMLITTTKTAVRSLSWLRSLRSAVLSRRSWPILTQTQEAFHDLLAEAKQHVQEPPQQPQQKIKLKLSQNPEPPPAPPKKITIHVGGQGGKASAAGSPAPATTGQSADGEATRNNTPLVRNPFGGSTATSINLTQLEKARSMSASAPSPSPSAAGMVKPDDGNRNSPAAVPQAGAATTHHQFAPIAQPPGMGMNGFASFPAPPRPLPPPKPVAADILEAQKYRSRLISRFP